MDIKAVEPKIKRKRNFNEDEKDLVAELFRDNSEVLLGKDGKSNTNQRFVA